MIELHYDRIAMLRAKLCGRKKKRTEAIASNDIISLGRSFMGEPAVITGYNLSESSSGSAYVIFPGFQNEMRPFGKFAHSLETKCRRRVQSLNI